MVGAEFEALVADIHEHGLRDPIVTHEGMILDGRNRYRACQQLGIAPACKSWDGIGEPAAYVASTNIHRRHLDVGQRAIIAAALATMKRGHADSQRIDATQQSDDRSFARSVLSTKNAAAIMKVSEKSVRRAKTVLRDGTSDEIAAVERGDVKVASIARAIREGQSPDQRAVLIGGFKDRRGRALPQRPLAECMARGLDQIDNTIEVVQQMIARDDAAAESQFCTWLDRLAQSRAALSRIIHLGRNRVLP